MLVTLPILLAAAPIASDGNVHSRISRVATASVTIIRIEPVSATPPAMQDRPQDRQYRRRDAMPLVEFF